MTTEPVATWRSAEAAELWQRGAARRAKTLAVQTEQMFQAAGLRPGMRVLDVAAGTGDQSVLAAQKVGPDGSVLAIDVSDSMLSVAEQAARVAGLSNIQTRVADASAVDLPHSQFDAAICRFGLMFMPDLHQALVRVYQALKPGGMFAALVWSTEEKNPYIGLQIAPVRELHRLPSPPPSIVRTTSLGASGKLEQALRDAGFVSVAVTALPTPRPFASLDEAFDAMITSSPTRGELVRDMSNDEREQYPLELRRRLEAYCHSDGTCVLPGEALLGVGTRDV